jgi:hypothetical protein
MSAGHGHLDPAHKRAAILIAALAALLAISETLGKSAQTDLLRHHIEASNLWAFFQAKTIRQTVVRTAVETAQLAPPDAPPPAGGEARAKQLAAWQANIGRWESEPDTGEGRRELMVRARDQEARRDRAGAAYHHFELASAAFQLAIVLASAAVVTGAGLLLWVAAGLGLAGLAAGALGWFAPALLHL